MRIRRDLQLGKLKTDMAGHDPTHALRPGFEPIAHFIVGNNDSTTKCFSRRSTCQRYKPDSDRSAKGARFRSRSLRRSHLEVAPALQALPERPPARVVLRRGPALQGLLPALCRTLAVAGPVSVQHLEADGQLHPQLSGEKVRVARGRKGRVRLGRLELLLPQLQREGAVEIVWLRGVRAYGQEDWQRTRDVLVCTIIQQNVCSNVCLRHQSTSPLIQGMYRTCASTQIPLDKPKFANPRVRSQPYPVKIGYAEGSLPPSFRQQFSAGKKDTYSKAMAVYFQIRP